VVHLRQSSYSFGNTDPYLCSGGGEAFVLGKNAMKVLEDISNEIVVILVIIVYLILIDCLLHGVYFICVEGYHFYVSYRIAAAQIGSEKQLLLVRDIITDIILRNCIIGAIFFLMTPFVWLARYFSDESCEC
jgi:hypothetical protein